MPIPWISFSRLSHRPISTVLVVLVLAFFLRVLVLPSSFAPDPPFEVVLEDSALEFDLVVEPDWQPPSEQERVLGKHTYTPDGLLLVNPEGPHPIFQLIRDAEAAWDAKIARASKTLDEAVAEYRRRYRRAPPLGFDKWWDYAVKNHVRLPDEYDEIFDDIELFWGIDPAELAKTQEAFEKSDHVLSVEKTDDHPRLKGTVDGILGLLSDVEADLPPLRVTFSAYDNPGKFTDWQIKSLALKAAANGTTLTRADLPLVKENGWLQACPPDSPARLHPPSYPPSSAAPPPSLKTFIVSHRDAMDPCMHPSLLTSHGQFLSHKKGPFPQSTLAPRFSLCSTLLHHDLRPPVPYGWNYETDLDLDDEEDVGAFVEDVPWEHKTNDRLGWRGRTTGMYAAPDAWWMNGHRARLVTLANALDGNVSVLHVPTSESVRSAEASPVGKPESMALAELNPAWMDVAFTGVPVGCDKDGGICAEMARMWAFQQVQERDEEGQYKFILDVDGNGWSGRFKRLITSNALIFKATIYPEWFTSRIEPWVHYVPIQVSYADLYDAVSFFRVHDDLARRIARAGKTWSRRFWRREDMTAYLYRLLLEYARVMSLNREKMDYIG